MPIIVDDTGKITYNPDTGKVSGGTDVVSLAKRVAKYYEIEWAIFGATIEAETSWRNIVHKYDSVYQRHGMYAVGYGGVMLNWHYHHAKRIIKDWNISEPGFDYNKKPNGHTDNAHAWAYMNWLVGNATVSLAFMALVLKGYWEEAGRDFTKFTKSYVGPKVPAEDIERRRKIYEKYLGGHVPAGVVAEIDTGGSGAGNTDPSKITLVKDIRETNIVSQRDPRVNLPPIPNIAGQVPKPDKLPPDYYNDDFTKLKHRLIQNGVHYARIGDCHLIVPPTQIRVSESNGINIFKTVRQRQSIKTHSGAKTKMIEMSLMFPTKRHINGINVEGPNGETYYMDGLNSLLAQMRTMPFLPIENHYLNVVHKVYAVALLNINIETVPGFPHFLKAELTMLEFDSSPYIYAPSEFYDMHFMWPLFRWHYQRRLRQVKKEIPTQTEFTGDQLFSIWKYSEAALQGYEKKVFEENQKKLNETMNKLKDKDKTNDHTIEREMTMFDLNMKEDSKLLEKVDFPNTLTLVNATASTGNTFQPLNIEETGKPAYQYFGSQDTRFHLIFETTDDAAIKALRMIKDDIDRISREYRERFVGGAMVVENPFVNFHGVNSVLWESLAVNTVPGFPGRYMVAITLISFDKTQYQDEMLNFVSGAWDDSGKGAEKFTEEEIENALAGSSLKHFDNYITQEVRAEMALNAMELYPDLSLPTYTEVNAIIPRINAYRSDKGLSPLPISKLTPPIDGRHVDPDFYFSYPSIETLSAAVNKIDPDLGLDQYNWENFYGPKMNEMFLDNHTHKGKTTNKDLASRYGSLLGMQYDESTNKFIGNVKDGYATVLNHLKEDRNYVVNSKNYQKKFWTAAWTKQGGGEWVEGKAQAFKGINYQVSYFRGQMPSKRRELKNENVEDNYRRMLHDAMKYDRRGTMMRAFPTYCFVIIDEGEVINAARLWNKYYSYHSIVDISVLMDKKNPMHTATITLSNVYGSLSHTNRFMTSMPEQNNPHLADLAKLMWDSIFHKINARALEERRKIHDAAQLYAGARIHLRLGYGSTASMLPPVFNGVIAEISAGDVVQIVAQSDGHELTKVIASSAANWLDNNNGDNTNTPFFEGTEPQEIFRHYMVDRNDNWLFAYRETADAKNYDSAYGIEHFGYLRVNDERGVSDFFNPIFGIFGNEEKAMNAEDYDIMKNIYMTTYIGGTVEEEAVANQKVPSYEELFEAERKKLEKEMVWTNTYRNTNKKHDISKYKITNYKMAGHVDKPIIKYVENQMHIGIVLEAMEDGKVQYQPRKYGVPDGPVQTIKLSKSDITVLREAILHWFAMDYWGVYTAGDTANEARVQEVLVSAPIKSKHTDDIRDMAKKIADEHKEVHKKTRKLQKELREKVKAAKKAQKERVGEAAGFGEKNVTIKLDDKSPWEIFRTIARITPEFIVYPHIHNFHYTLFFGKPHWDVQCGYVLPPMDKEWRDDFESVEGHKWGEKISDYVEVTKPFQQAHFYIGGTDIVGNNIRAVGQNLTSAVIPIYYMNSAPVEGKEIIWADYSIRTSFQSTKLVNTDLVQDMWTPLDLIGIPDSWFDKAWTGVVNLFGESLGGTGQTKHQMYAIRFAQGVISESFEDMYQGELTVIGDPSAKPYDMFYMMDSINRMAGVAQMGRVIHHFGISTGFVTSIKPDLVVAKNPKPHSDSKDWNEDENAEPTGVFMQAGMLSMKGVYYGIAILSTMHTLKKMGIKIDSATFMRLLNAKKHTMAVVNGTKKVFGALRTIRTLKDIRTAWSGFMTAAAVGGIATGPPGWASLIITAGLWVGGEIIFKYLERIFTQRFKNVIKIFPLYHKNVPYVAGINGAKHLIPGWQINADGSPVSVGYSGADYNPPSDTLSEDVYETEIHGQNASDKVSSGDVSVGGTNTSIGNISGFFNSIDKSKMRSHGNAFVFPISFANSSKRNLAGANARVNSHMGMRWGKMHWGVDLSKGSNTRGDKEIYSMSHGRVIATGHGSSMGNYVKIRHEYPAKLNGPNRLGPNGEVVQSKITIYTVYMHLQSIHVTKNQSVKAGHLIGIMGTTGESTGVHLHFEINVPKTSKYDLTSSQASSSSYVTRFDPMVFFKYADELGSDFTKFIGKDSTGKW